MQIYNFHEFFERVGLDDLDEISPAYETPKNKIRAKLVAKRALDDLDLWLGITLESTVLPKRLPKTVEKKRGS